MVYRKFGKTEEMVSVLGFGCMRLPIRGESAANIDEELATTLIRSAIDCGVNYIDTAYPYHGVSFGSGGQSEPFLAKALKNGYREKVKLATKLPSWMVQSRSDMDRLLDEQLKRLDTDHIDFYLVHGLNRQFWDTVRDNGVAEFLDAAIRDGKIGYAGFSFHDRIDVFREIVDAYDWSFCQIQYNYMDEEFQAGTEGLRYAAEKGLGIAVMEPLRGGRLAVDLPEEAMQAIRESGVDRTPAELGLRWIWNHPEVSVVLSGMNEEGQLEENIRSAVEETPFSENEEKIVERIRDIIFKKIAVDCTGCGYCMPCPTGVNIVSVFSMYNNHSMFGKEGAYMMRLGPKQRASNCSECGACEEHCPQNIAIRENLKKAKAVFE